MNRSSKFSCLTENLYTYNNGMSKNGREKIFVEINFEKVKWPLFDYLELTPLLAPSSRPHPTRRKMILTVNL